LVPPLFETVPALGEGFLDSRHRGLYSCRVRKKYGRMMKYSVCNELFGSMPLPEVCRLARISGFSGVEFAPYTVFGDFSSGDVSRGVAAMRLALDAEGLEFAGFHWLLAKPEGLHLASLDSTVKKKSRDHVARLLEAAGEMGGGELILGSPKQRHSLPGQDRTETTKILCGVLAELAPLALACRSEILIEQLSPDQTDVINTMEEAVGCVDSIGAPSIQGMFDFHNAMSEKEPWQALVEKYYPYIHHIHINEVDGRAPGTGTSDYGPCYEILKSRKYDRWVSIEIFEIPEDPAATLSESMSLFKALEKR